MIWIIDGSPELHLVDSTILSSAKTVQHLRFEARVVSVIDFGADRERQPRAVDTSLSWLLVVGSIWIGTLGAFRWLPSTWARFRSLLANWTWPLLYLIVEGGQRLPRPTSLHRVASCDGYPEFLRLHRFVPQLPYLQGRRPPWPCLRRSVRHHLYLILHRDHRHFPSR